MPWYIKPLHDAMALLFFIFFETFISDYDLGAQLGSQNYIAEDLVYSIYLSNLSRTTKLSWFIIASYYH
ncbi:hypothetical protein THF5H11_10784 [Vibrio jasicida]|nr:hypothetical protein THF5H11_10784 [Vibrio jasicida]